MPHTATTDSDILTGDGPPSQPHSDAMGKSKADGNERKYQRVLETVLAQKGIHRRTQRAEYELVQSCRKKKAMLHYEAPPNNDLGIEPRNKRKARHLRVRRALQSEDERTERLAKERDEKRQTRKDIKEGVYQPKYKVKKRENDEKKDNICLCCHKNISAAALASLYVGVREEGTCHCCYKCHKDPNGKCPMGKCYRTPVPPKKEKIEIKGKGGFPLCACADVTNAKYVSVEDPPSLGYVVEYYKRDEVDTADHRFSVGFDNLRAYSTRYVCPKEEILSCEIHFNGKKVGTIGECTYTTAEKSSRPGHLLITHHFSFSHNTEHCVLNWGFCETFSLNLVFGPLPEDTAAKIERCLQSSGSKRLEVFDYGLISQGGMMLSSVQFLDITFRETSMKWGDLLHFMAWKVIWEQKTGKPAEIEFGRIRRELSNAKGTH